MPVDTAAPKQRVENVHEPESVHCEPRTEFNEGVSQSDLDII